MSVEDAKPNNPRSPGLGTLAEAWDASPYVRLIVPVLCVAWEAMMFTRVVFAGVDDALAAPSSWLVLLSLMVVGCAALFFRYRFAVAIVLIESAVCLAAAVLGALAYLYFLPLIALYACLARSPRRAAVAGAVIGAATILVSAAIDGLAHPLSGASIGSSFSLQGAAPALASIGYPLILVAGAALISRFRWQRLRETKEATRREAERRAELARAADERDRALAKSRIAAELHDSVGHDLTAIIALSEGLASATGDAETDRAIETINRLARAGLSDTRQAVSALASFDEDALDAKARTHSLHRWDEIEGLTASVRTAGIVAAVTETGRRPADEVQADVAFRVCREATTNALRHASDMRRLTLSIDHAPEGACTVTVRDDGRSTRAGEALAVLDGALPSDGTGMGLARLSSVVEAAGGAFAAGVSDEGGWTVRATIPSQCAEREGQR